eukprot:scaffold29847_cov68-Phaeocystis_antarctica.AAC.2
MTKSSGIGDPGQAPEHHRGLLEPWVATRACEPGHLHSAAAKPKPKPDPNPRPNPNPSQQCCGCVAGSGRPRRQSARRSSVRRRGPACRRSIRGRRGSPMPPAPASLGVAPPCALGRAPGAAWSAGRTGARALGSTQLPTAFAPPRCRRRRRCVNARRVAEFSAQPLSQVGGGVAPLRPGGVSTCWQALL